MSIILINTRDDLDNLFNNNPDKTIIIKIGAEWCIPCKNINSLYKQLYTANNNINILFTEINSTDDNNDLIDFLNINSLPTFLFYKNGILIHTIVGSNKLEITKYIHKL